MLLKYDYLGLIYSCTTVPNGNCFYSWNCFLFLIVRMCNVIMCKFQTSTGHYLGYEPIFFILWIFLVYISYPSLQRLHMAKRCILRYTYVHLSWGGRYYVLYDIMKGVVYKRRPQNFTVFYRLLQAKINRLSVRIWQNGRPPSPYSTDVLHGWPLT